MPDLAQVLSSTGAIPPGTRLGKFEVLDRIGGGGMAEIYVARAHEAGGVTQWAVIKRVLPHLARDPEFIGMFLNEAKITASLDHPNIAHVKEVGRAGEEFFLALELINGVDLKRMLEQSATRGGVPLPVAFTIVGAVADALHYAHERGVVHRDVSPSNVMVTYEGHAKVLDFGIAKAARTAMTRAGTIKGKVGYMSPEQCMAEAVDRRSDVFALGILLYELTLGRRLFKGDSEFAIMNQITLGRIVPPSRVEPSYPGALEQILLRALAVHPDERFQTARDFGRALEDFAHREQLRTSAVVVAAWLREHLSGTVAPPSGVASPKPQRAKWFVPATWSIPGKPRKGRVAAIGLLGAVVGIGIGAAAVAMLRPGNDDGAAGTSVSSEAPSDPEIPAAAVSSPPPAVAPPSGAPPAGTVAMPSSGATPDDADAEAAHSKGTEPASEPEAQPKPERRPRKGHTKRSKSNRTKDARSSLLPPSRGGSLH